MNAMELLHHLQHKGINLTLLEGNRIKAYPSAALNDNVRNVIRTNKLALVAALRHEHIAKRKALGYRVDVLKVLISRLLNKNFTSASQHALEEFIDKVLKEFKYNLEKAIDHYRGIAPKPATTLAQCDTCGYRSLFCKCRIQVAISATGFILFLLYFF